MIYEIVLIFKGCNLCKFCQTRVLNEKIVSAKTTFSG